MNIILQAILGTLAAIVLFLFIWGMKRKAFLSSRAQLYKAQGVFMSKDAGTLVGDIDVYSGVEEHFEKTGEIVSPSEFMHNKMCHKLGYEKYDPAKFPTMLFCSMGANVISVADPEIVRDLMTVKNN